MGSGINNLYGRDSTVNLAMAAIIFDKVVMSLSDKNIYKTMAVNFKLKREKLFFNKQELIKHIKDPTGIKT